MFCKFKLIYRKFNYLKNPQSLQCDFLVYMGKQGQTFHRRSEANQVIDKCCSKKIRMGEFCCYKSIYMIDYLSVISSSINKKTKLTYRDKRE